MKYEHQINWANACNNNLNISISRSVWNAWIVLLSTLTLLMSERMANSEVCTLYDRKNQTNAYDFLQITQVHALLLSVSFKPILVYFSIVLHILTTLWQFWCSHCQFVIFIILDTGQTLWIFQSVSKTLWIICLTL